MKIPVEPLSAILQVFFLMNEVIENDSEPMISDSLIDFSQAKNVI